MLAPQCRGNRVGQPGAYRHEALPESKYAPNNFDVEEFMIVCTV